MSMDTLTELQIRLNDRRAASALALTILGHPIPATDQEWLMYDLNETLRQKRLQKPLENLRGEAWSDPTEVTREGN